MEPKLIYTDNKKFDAIVYDLKQYTPLLQKLKAEYEKLELGDFDDVIFLRIKSTGSKRIKLKFDHVINQQLKSIGVSLDVVKKTFQKEADEKFSCFDNAVNDFKNFRPEYYYSSTSASINPKYISFLNGKFTQSENDIENILEDYCRVYIETENGLKLYDALTKFTEAYFVIEKTLEGSKYNKRTLAKCIKEIDSYFITDINDKPTINPYSGFDNFFKK